MIVDEKSARSKMKTFTYVFIKWYFSGLSISFFWLCLKNNNFLSSYLQITSAIPCLVLSLFALSFAASAASLSYILTFTFTKLRHFRQPITRVAGDVMFYFSIYAYGNKVEALLYASLEMLDRNEMNMYFSIN